MVAGLETVCQETEVQPWKSSPEWDLTDRAGPGAYPSGPQEFAGTG